MHRTKVRVTTLSTCTTGALKAAYDPGQKRQQLKKINLESWWPRQTLRACSSTNRFGKRQTMEHMLQPMFDIVGSRDPARRLSGTRGGAPAPWKIRTRPPVLQFRRKRMKSRRNLMIGVLLFWAANCAAQGSLTLAFAQPVEPLAIAPKTANSGAVFAFTSRSSKPSVLISMIEEEGQIAGRSLPSITTSSSLEDRGSFKSAIDSPFFGTTYRSQIISGRESVSRYTQNDHYATESFERIASVDEQQTSRALDAERSRHALFERPKHSTLTWLEDREMGSMRLTDLRSWSDDKTTEFEPLLVVGIGSYRLPISFYAPALR
jgi:hypothetical protein